MPFIICSGTFIIILTAVRETAQSAALFIAGKKIQLLRNGTYEDIRAQ